MAVGQSFADWALWIDLAHEPGSGMVTSVKVVEKRVSEEVANGQAAMGGSLAGSASISGGVKSVIPSICM